MIEAILDVLAHTSFLSNCTVLEQEQAPGGEFTLKVRCRIERRFVIQVRVRLDQTSLRYSYQFFAGANTILRWDNAPHFPALENYPHHMHDSKGIPQHSRLAGDPLQDLLLVLKEIQRYLETKT